MATLTNPFVLSLRNAARKAVRELESWHRDAEAEYGYQCPGCETCMIIIPELRRSLQKLGSKEASNDSQT